MYCIFCGKQIADNATFCPYCGKAVPQGKAAPQGKGTADGLGSLKIGLIVLAAAAAVGLGVFGINRIVSQSAKLQRASTIEDVIDEENPKESEMAEEYGFIDEAPEESAPIDEALEQYRNIVSQADGYEYYEYDKYEADQPWFELAGYRYALVQLQPNDPVPTLLLEKEIMDTELSVPYSYARIFQYDPDTKTVRQPTETIADGGIRGGLSMAGDGYGIVSLEWSGGTGKGSVERITLEGDSLNRETFWRGQIFEMPESITFIEIEWHESGEMSALDSWTAPDTRGASSSEQADGSVLPTDGDRIVLTGTVGTFDYDDIVALQGQPDPNGWDEDSVEYSRSRTYRVIVLDTPQTLRLYSGEDDEYFSHEALMINLEYIDGMDQYEGRHITFSIDPYTTHWPSDTSLPFGQPFTTDIHILD